MEWPAGFDLPISKLAPRVSSSMCARNPTRRASRSASGSLIAEIGAAGCVESVHQSRCRAGGAWLQRFALADDHEESNGSTVLTFWEAAEIARKLARGDDPVGEVEAGRPFTIRDAVAAYERDLKARDAEVGKRQMAPLPPDPRADVEAGRHVDPARGPRLSP